MIKNVFKRFFGVGIFVLFGCLFNSCFVNGTRYNVTVGDTKNLGQNIEVTPDNAGNFFGYDTINELSKNVFYLADRSDNNFYNTKMAFYYWIEEGLAYYRPGSYKAGGLVTKFYITDYAGYSNITQPNASSLSTGTYGDIADLGITYGDITDIAYNDQWLSSQRGFPLCFRGQNKDFSICAFCNEGTQACGLEQTGSFINPSDTQIALFSSIPDSYLKNSIWYSGGGGGSGGTIVNANVTIDNTIAYYENTSAYGFNKNMCYVGTNDLISSYGTSGLSFVEGTGKTIFELYESLYSGFGSNKIRNVGTFIDVWTTNYFQWFYNSNEEYGVRRLLTYNGPDTLYDVSYQDLTFPFSNNPVAIFFMATELYDGYLSRTDIGNDVSYYCYLKLNYNQIKDGTISFTGDVLPLVPDNIQQNVNTYITNMINNGSSGNYRVPDLSLYSGDYTLTDNLELDNVFTTFLDRFNGKLSEINISYSIGIIPDWILYPLIFLILFRIMKH